MESGNNGNLEKEESSHLMVLPFVFYLPETYVGFGCGVLFKYRLPGTPDNKRYSTIGLAGIYTIKKQFVAGVRPVFRFGDDRLIISIGTLFMDFPDRYFGIGNENKAGDYEIYKDRFYRIVPEISLRTWKGLYIGTHYFFRKGEIIEYEKDGVLDRERVNGFGSTRASGAGLQLLWDTRKSIYWPLKGDFLEFRTTLYRKELGSDFNADEYKADLRRYQPLWSENILVIRFVFQSISGEMPFQLLPELGGGWLMRGYYNGQLRDRNLAAAMAEYRIPFSQRWSAVIFGSTGRVADDKKDLLHEGFHAAGGTGVRYAVHVKDRTNIRIDVAYGDELYFYLQFAEAF